ncbi:MAG: ribosomal subunit interface protein [Epulopiscium sp. Nuni2H_MBin001]|nr:MAG: ribosomal subunit interface protein [Epulopiscium sp. Nuni2H_MBin001]
MKYTIVTRNTDLTPGMDEAVSKSTTKLDKYFNDTANMNVTLTVEKNCQIVEMSLPFNGQILRSEVQGENIYKILDEAVDTLEKQVLRFKNKLRSKTRHADLSAFTHDFIESRIDEEDDSVQIKRRKKFAIKPMSAEEAVLQMELVGHNFYVYLDAQSEEVNVVYKRKNNSYGLIEPSLDDY